MQDALVFGGMCISLLNHADRVKVACLAQLVNAIAPIMTQTGGPAWRQTIFWPFAHFSNFGRGRVLRAEIESPTYAAKYYDPRGTLEQYFDLPATPYLKLAAVYDEERSILTMFALNRSLTDEIALDVTLREFSETSLDSALQLRDADLNATNTLAQPDRVAPAVLKAIKTADGSLTAKLSPASWNVIRLKVLR